LQGSGGFLMSKKKKQAEIYFNEVSKDVFVRKLIG
jgi:hypothetical protein